MPNVTVHDLYEMYPDFNIDVVHEQEVLFGHEIVIWHHPFYWYNCPPLLKQWIDLVLQYNWAYGPNGFALREKLCLNALTAGGPREVYRSDGRNKYAIGEFLRPFEQTANLCGMHYLAPFAVLGTNRIKADEIIHCQEEYKRVLNWLASEDSDVIQSTQTEFLNDLAFIKKGAQS
jgi:glutathione-regulated potassium-efflux system ancillary protein KefG